ncbi:MAG: hypothetical protein MI784_14605 [Cytophagales bacterium]|nr:hypothetical protein [Cytophagales bacterium]
MEETTQKLNEALRLIERLSFKKDSKKPSGGQSGHKGHSLKKVETPDGTAELKPNFCEQCGHSFSEDEFLCLSERQVSDLPQTSLQTKVYGQYAEVCACGNHQKADYPMSVNAPVQYGLNVDALAGYLSVCQYVPYKQMTEFFRGVFTFSLSQSTIDNHLERLSGKGSKVPAKSIRSV